MKIVSLNVCGGSFYQSLLNYLQSEVATTDIFCLQEIFHTDSGMQRSGVTHTNLLNELRAALQDFDGHFAPRANGINLDDEQIDPAVETGLALFIKKGIEVISIENTFVVGNYNDRFEGEAKRTNLPAVLQKATVGYQGSVIVIANMHGISYPGTKLDTEFRLAQSEGIVKVMGDSQMFVLCGDFNLLPDTKSIKLLEALPARNLIKEFGITSTRPISHVEKYAPESRQYFADYVFVSPELQVKSFAVPEVEASDHLPLVLDF